MDVVVTIYSIITYILDLGSDVWVASFHYIRAVEAEQAGDHASLHWYWFGLTIALIIIPSLVMSAFSLRWYLSDYQQACQQEEGKRPVTKRNWFLRAILMLLQLGPVARYIDSIRYGLKSRWYLRKMKMVENVSREWKNKTKDKVSDSCPNFSPEVLEKICKYECKAKYYYDLMLYEDADAAMLRLYECFLESAPQTILQMYILSLKFFACPQDPSQIHALSRCTENIQIDEKDSLDVSTTAEMASIILSITSLAWGLVAYHKALRFSRSDKANVSHASCIAMFLWRFFLLFPRVLVIALFASVFPAWHLSIFLGAHFLAMLIWMLSQKSRFCSNAVEERLFRFFAAVIHIFVFFNLVEGRTRFRVAAFYTVTLLENLTVVVMWMIFAADHHDIATKVGVSALVLGSFVLGICFMVLHYTKLHPNKANIPICLPRDEIPLCRETMADDSTHTGLCMSTHKGDGMSCEKRQTNYDSCIQNETAVEI